MGQAKGCPRRPLVAARARGFSRRSCGRAWGRGRRTTVARCHRCARGRPRLVPSAHEGTSAPSIRWGAQGGRQATRPWGDNWRSVKAAGGDAPSVTATGDDRRGTWDDRRGTRHGGAAAGCRRTFDQLSLTDFARLPLTQQNAQKAAMHTEDASREEDSAGHGDGVPPARVVITAAPLNQFLHEGTFLCSCVLAWELRTTSV